MPIKRLPDKKNGKAKYEVRVNYTDANGEYKRITRICYGLNEAKQIETELLAREKSLTTITLTELANIYFTSKKNENRETTIAKSRRAWATYVKDIIGDYKLDKLTPQVFAKWKNEINNRPLSLITKQNAYALLRSVINYGVKVDYLPKNNLTKLGNFKDSNYIKKKMDYYTPEEFNLYIREAYESALKIDFYDYYVFFSIAYLIGARKGEINALRWTDYYDGVIHINKSVNQKMKGIMDYETPPKNKSSVRDIVVPETLKKILDEHKQRLIDRNEYSENHRICGGLFSLRDSSIEKENKKYAELSGLKRIRVHDFRHSHASLLVNEGINILEIARRLGHSNIEQTLNTYSHFFPDQESKANEFIDKKFTGLFSEFSLRP